MSSMIVPRIKRSEGVFRYPLVKYMVHDILKGIYVQCYLKNTNNRTCNSENSTFKICFSNLD